MVTSGKRGNPEARWSSWRKTWHTVTFGVSFGGGGGGGDDDDMTVITLPTLFSLQKSESDAGESQGQGQRWDGADY